MIERLGGNNKARKTLMAAIAAAQLAQVPSVEAQDARIHFAAATEASLFPNNTPYAFKNSEAQFQEEIDALRGLYEKGSLTQESFSTFLQESRRISDSLWMEDGNFLATTKGMIPQRPNKNSVHIVDPGTSYVRFKNKTIGNNFDMRYRTPDGKVHLLRITAAHFNQKDAGFVTDPESGDVAAEYVRPAGNERAVEFRRVRTADVAFRVGYTVGASQADPEDVRQFAGVLFDPARALQKGLISFDDLAKKNQNGYLTKMLQGDGVLCKVLPSSVTPENLKEMGVYKSGAQEIVFDGDTPVLAGVQSVVDKFRDKETNVWYAMICYSGMGQVQAAADAAIRSAK